MLVSATVAAHVFILAFFKYYETSALWLVEQIGPGAQWLINPYLASWVLPIGLSFYSFQGLSYTIDHYREEGLAPRSYAQVLCFLSFFPTVMSGPIMRESTFFPQLRTSFAGEEDFPEGIVLILSGLFKKVVMATYLQSHLVDGVFAAPDEYSSAAALMAVYAYSVQIYCDFSGYTNIAMGVAQLMGFHIPKNFDEPYRSLNLQEFWHRWHISLSTWLRDYLYIPLGGNRKGNRYVNLMITMIIGGLWHGSSLGFLVWGTLHGAGLAVVHAWHRLSAGWQIRNHALRGLGNVVSWVVTMHVVALLWVFFRAEKYPQQRYHMHRHHPAYDVAKSTQRVVAYLPPGAQSVPRVHHRQSRAVQCTPHQKAQRTSVPEAANDHSNHQVHVTVTLAVPAQWDV